MGLETGVTYIDDLVATNPVGATDNVDEGDDHIRNIKTAVKGSFPNLGNAAVTKTAAEINDLATVTGTETLTNKTLTSPTLTTPSVANPTFTKESDPDEGGDTTFEGAGTYNDGRFDLFQSFFRFFGGAASPVTIDIETGAINGVSFSGSAASISGNLTGDVTSVGMVTSLAANSVDSAEIVADAVKASEMSFAALTRSSAVSITASGNYVVPAGLYNIVADSTASIFMELKDNGGTWRTSGEPFAGGLILGDNANIRLLNSSGGTLTIYYARMT